jgi:two-component system, sensor histidine kinase and response regulator
MVKAKLPRQGEQESEALRELKLICMSSLLSTTDEIVYFKDLQSRFLFVSAGWIAACHPGHTAEEMTGKTDFDVFSAEHASAAFEDEQRIIRTGEPLVAQVERETYGDGNGAWVSSTKMPLRDGRGQIIGTFGISRDVTARISAEQAVAQQARELSAQNERLRELGGLKDEFIALISHELRTPLTSIIGNVELLKDEGTSGTIPTQFVEVIDRNAQRLLRLIGDLLFLSQIQAGKMTVELRITDLAGVAARAVEQMQPEAQRKHIDLAFSATAVPPLAVDPERIAQLLGNLLSNAVKFTPAGGKVEVRLGTEDEQAVLTVTDTGVGVPAGDRERVFERFFRAAATTQQAIQGTGLGLTIGKAIVEAHHGTITADSDEGHGSTFTICLPLSPAPPPYPSLDDRGIPPKASRPGRAAALRHSGGGRRS